MSYFSLISSGLCLFVGIFVYFQQRHNKTNIFFAIYNAFIFLWNSGDFISPLLSGYPDLAIIYSRFAQIGGVLIVPTYIIFIHLLVGRNFKEIFKFKIPILFLACSVVLAGFVPTPFYIKEIAFHPFYQETAGVLFPFLMLYFISGTIYGLVQLILAQRRATSFLKKKQLVFYSAALIIALFSVISWFVMMVFFPKNPNSIVYIFEVTYSLITAFAILRYQLMDISVVIKRSSIYALMIFFVTATYLTLIFAFENIFRDYLGINSLVPRIVASIVLALTFLPIRNFFEKFIDKLFFKTKYEYTTALKRFSDELVKVLDLRELMDTIIFNISHTLNVDHIILLLFDHKSKMYKPKAYLGVGKPIRHIALSSRHKLISWLKANRSIAIRNRFYTENGQFNRDYHIIYKQMTMFKSEIGLPLIFNNEMIGILTLSEKKNGELYSTDDLNLLGSFANEAAIAFSNAIAYDNLKKTYIGTIEAFAKAIEAKDIYTRGHSERVLKISMAIATEMGLPRDQIETLRYASILHDVGKIAIEDRILNKQGALDNFEYEVIKQHPIVGANIVSTISFLNDAIDVVKHHHERFDGNGYPAGLKAENIPLLSRIISVADTFDAITSNRLYRQAVDNTMAVEEISRCSELQFDPNVVEAFVSAYKKNKIA